MGAAVGELRQIAHVPDQLFGGRDLARPPADPPFELADIHLVGHQIVTACREHGPMRAVVFRSARSLTKLGLADEPIAGHQERARAGPAAGRIGRSPAARSSWRTRPGPRSLGSADNLPTVRRKSRSILPVREVSSPPMSATTGMVDVLQEAEHGRWGRRPAKRCSLPKSASSQAALSEILVEEDEGSPGCRAEARRRPPGRRRRPWLERGQEAERKIHRPWDQPVELLQDLVERPLAILSPISAAKAAQAKPQLGPSA